ncbi:MAG: NCS2 family permease [Ignavibacteria bacterium]|nr:NCS2 family permease [Ignavibacteria bacterium]
MQNFYRLRENNTTVRIEVLAGITSFLACMYIIVVNPAILKDAGMPFSAVLTATVLVCFFSSIAMGLYANNPIIVAPGMGINAFFTYTAVIGMGMSWQAALGTVFWSGVIIMLLSFSNIRVHILQAVPHSVRMGLASGIGLFIALIGLENSGFIIANKATLISKAPLNAMTATFLIGLAVTIILVIKKVPASLILGIIITTILSIPIGRLWGDASAVNFGTKTLVSFNGIFSAPDFSLFMSMDFLGALKFSAIGVIFTFVFVDMFDSISTFMGIAEAGNLLDKEGQPRNVKQSLIADGFSSVISGVFGTSAGTAYIESATGIREGGRTGLTAVVGGLLFLPCMFFSPLLSIIPAIATAPILIVVGALFMIPMTRLDWTDFEISFPAFIAMIMIPFTFSINEGIVFGLLSYTIIKLVLGKYKELTPTLIILDIISVIFLIYN